MLIIDTWGVFGDSPFFPKAFVPVDVTLHVKLLEAATLAMHDENLLLP